MADAFQALHEAARRLSQDSGNPRLGLKEALARICGIKSYQLPREIQEEFVRVMDEVGYVWRFSRNSHLERMQEVYDHVDRLSDGDCARLVLAIVNLEKDYEAAESRRNPRLL